MPITTDRFWIKSVRLTAELLRHTGDAGGLLGVSSGEHAARRTGRSRVSRTGDQQFLQGNSITRLKKALEAGTQVPFAIDQDQETRGHGFIRDTDADQQASNLLQKSGAS
jgi:hypothetical protein